MKSKLFLLFCLASTPLWAVGNDARMLTQRLDTKQTLVVAEGQNEARSEGSYSIRFYGDAPAANGTLSAFQYGIISMRNGELKDIRQIPLAKKSAPAIVILMKNPSTGHVSADAYSLSKTGDKLTLQRCVRDIPEADLITSLQKARHANPVDCAM